MAPGAPSGAASARPPINVPAAASAAAPIVRRYLRIMLSLFAPILRTLGCVCVDKESNKTRQQIRSKSPINAAEQRDLHQATLCIDIPR